MKNQIILYLIVSLLITSHNAIKAQDCTYIYRNDGNINAFFNDNIDSLKYSKIDLNGTPKDTWVTQEIFTADSIYRIPLATIDSIGFITPETIYRPGVIKLEDGLMPYITECDSLTLYLAPSVPKEIIPHKGDRLVTLNMTDILPVGFAGKVIDVRTEKNKHIVECELTPLNDIFEQYYGSTNIPVEPQQASRAISTNPDPNHIRQFKISSQLSANIGAVAGTSDLGIGLSHSVGMEVTGNLYVQTFLIVRPFQPTLFSTTIIADINTENKFETSIKGYASHDFGPDIKANLPCAPLIQVFMSNGIYLRFNGEIVAKRSYSQSNKFIFHYEHNGNKEAVIPPIMKFVAGDTQDEYTEVYGSAVLGLGLYSEVGLGIFDKNIANVTVRGEAGVEIEANAEIVKEEDSPSTKTYDSLNYDDIISARLVSNSSISVKALCFEGGFNTGVVFEPYQLGKWGLVPEFIQPSFIKSPENQGSISATATVGRKCLIPTKVGYALYDKNNKRIDSWENPALYNNELFVMSHRFDNLKSNNEYTVYPYVKLLDNEYLATPNSKVELSVQITTDKASDIKNNSANLTGKIEDITQNDDYTCGFYWSSTSTVGAEKGAFISSTVNNGGTFSAQLDNLQPETTYYYRACATINGETLLADNTKSFTTEKEEEGNNLEIKVQSPIYYTNRSIKKIEYDHDSPLRWIIYLENENASVNGRLDASHIDVLLPSGFINSPDELIDFKYYYKEEKEDTIHPTHIEYSMLYSTPFNIDFELDNLTPLKKHTLWVEVKNRSGNTLKDSIDFVSCPKVNEEEFVDMGTGILWASKNVGADNYYEFGTEEEISDEEFSNGRKPTHEEFKNLFLTCNIYFGSHGDDNVGFFLVSPNGNTLFFPVTSFNRNCYRQLAEYSTKKGEFNYIGEDGILTRATYKSIGMDPYTIKYNEGWAGSFPVTRLVR